MQNSCMLKASATNILLQEMVERKRDGEYPKLLPAASAPEKHPPLPPSLPPPPHFNKKLIREQQKTHEAETSEMRLQQLAVICFSFGVSKPINVFNISK